MKGLYEVMFGTAAVLVVMIWSQVLADTLDIPEVYTSTLTQQCERVINYAEGDEYSCDNLPEVYNKVWVR
jgi:hypothetical protein